MTKLLIFQPTRPLRGATVRVQHANLIDKFQPTRPLRGATAGLMHRLSAFDISTHAPLAGRDRRRFLSAFRSDRISTHAPLAGRDQQKNLFPMSTKISTHAPLAGRDCHG